MDIHCLNTSTRTRQSELKKNDINIKLILVLVMLVSVTSLAIISFDRMIGVVYPFHTHLKHWQTHVIIACIWVYSIGFAVPFAQNRNFIVSINLVIYEWCGKWRFLSMFQLTE